MPKFNYVAMDSRGKEAKGTLEVGNQNEAISRLKEMGYFPTKVVEAERTKEKSPAKKDKSAPAPGPKGKKKGGLNFNISIPAIPGLGGKVKPKILTTFTRQLATLVDAGLPLLRGLRVLERQEKTRPCAGSSTTWRSPSKAAARSPRVWPSIRAFSIGFTSTWSRPANWAACSKSS